MTQRERDLKSLCFPGQISSLNSTIKKLQNEVEEGKAEKNATELRLKESLELSEKKCSQLENDIKYKVRNEELYQGQNQGMLIMHKFASI